jgi:hypothetical protein
MFFKRLAAIAVDARNVSCEKIVAQNEGKCYAESVLILRASSQRAVRTPSIF